MGSSAHRSTVMIDQACDLAAEINDEDEQLHRRRADLDSLSRLLTNEDRRLNKAPQHLPAVISRALYPADRQLTGADRDMPATDWAARYSELCEAPPGPLSDT